MASKNELRRALLKAFTIVEWVCGEGYMLQHPHHDADDLLLELVPLLDVEDSEAAVEALAKLDDFPALKDFPKKPENE